MLNFWHQLSVSIRFSLLWSMQTWIWVIYNLTLTSSFQICINSLRWQHITTLKCIVPMTFALHTNTHQLKKKQKTTHTQSRVNLQGAGYLFHRTRLSSSVKTPFIHITHNKSHQPSKHSWHTRHLFECVCRGEKKSVIRLNLLAPPPSEVSV